MTLIVISSSDEGSGCFGHTRMAVVFIGMLGLSGARLRADGDRVATFREVACTEEFTELLDRSREIRIRLLAEESQLKASGKPTFAPYHEGGWMKPKNPILTKCGLEVALVGTAQRL